LIAIKTDSLSKSALAKSLVVRTVERSPGPNTATTAANLLGKAFPFEYVSKLVVSVAAILRVDLKCSLRLPEVALPHARQTVRLADIIRLIGFVVGGLPGSRLLARLAIAIATSDDTVLRRVKKRPRSDVIDEPIRTLGVDDWAWRNGEDYGTILVDPERHRVADLLPGQPRSWQSGWPSTPQ
jgi:hypothetical protein